MGVAPSVTAGKDSNPPIKPSLCKPRADAVDINWAFGWPTQIMIDFDYLVVGG